MAKVALLIGVSEYEPGLEPLPSAVKDVAALQQVLANPEMGEFDVADITVLPNPDRQAMEDAIYRLFANRQKDDLVLLYFSGHGVLDDSSEFYFASRSTRKEQGKLVPPTAVAARSVQSWMEQSRSQRQVIILDSCFSGAFAKGVKAKDSGSVNVEQFLGGKGRAILTASTSTQYALAQDSLELSVYTHYLVEGIRTGGADQDDDGFIGVEELHTYASSKVREAAPAMTPEFYPVKDGYKIILAKSPKDDPQLKYRKQVKQVAQEDEGDFSFINRAYLDDLQRSLGLLPEDAIAIETEELEPYRQRRAKVDRYRDVFSGAIAHRYPLTERDRVGLQRLQQILSLRDEDIALIEAPLLADRQPERPSPQATATPRRVERTTAPSASAVITRQQFLKWAGFGGGGLIVALVANQIMQNSQSSSTSEPSTPQPSPQIATVDFETVKVDSQGKIVQRIPGQATVLKQDLGNGVMLEMVKIPAGEFLMGSPESEMERQSSESPQHRVKVPEFWMGKFAVTQAQWSQVAQLPKVKLDLNADPANSKGVKRPVERVSWEEAVEFCERLSRKTGKPYRLPSEAEWEYACRAGTTSPFHFGETITADLVNCNGGYPYGNAPKSGYLRQTTDVGSFPANAFGLYDMHGNIWEWCADPWHDNYQGAPTDGSVWTANGDSGRRVIRGGSWDAGPEICRSAYRDDVEPRDTYVSVGFRVVCRSPRTS